MRGYRGFLKEFSRTGSARAFWLQVRGGLRHLFRRRDRGPDGVEAFLAHYGADGVALPDSARRARIRAAERCLVCGLCSEECARVGGAPPLDPMEAVVAASRLASEAQRFGVGREEDAETSPCASCRACETRCPTAIPIAEIIRDFG